MRSILVGIFLMLVFGTVVLFINRPQIRPYVDDYLYRFEICRSWVQTSTRYGPAYSESKFRKIRVGTPVEKLRAALGEPLAYFTNEHGGETWMYSFHQQGRETVYWKSRVICTSNNVVSGKLSFVNWD